MSVRIHWRCAVLLAGIGQNSLIWNMDADSRAWGTTTTDPSAVFVPSRIQLKHPNNLLCSKEPAILFNSLSVTPFAGHLTSRKLLHTDALNSIPRGLAIKMETAQHASIGLDYGAIGRKYWTPHPYSLSLKPLRLADARAIPQESPGVANGKRKRHREKAASICRFCPRTSAPDRGGRRDHSDSP